MSVNIHPDILSVRNLTVAAVYQLRSNTAKQFDKVNEFALEAFEEISYWFQLGLLATITIYAVRCSLTHPLTTLFAFVICGALYKHRHVIRAKCFVYMLLLKNQIGFAKQKPLAAINEKIFIGLAPLRSRFEEIKAQGVRSILAISKDERANMSTFFSNPVSPYEIGKEGLNFKHIKWSCEQTPSIYQLDAIALIVKETLSQEGSKTYIYSEYGSNHSALATISYLIKYKKCKGEEAVDLIKEIYPDVCFSTLERGRIHEFYDYIKKTQKAEENKAASL